MSMFLHKKLIEEERDEAASTKFEAVAKGAYAEGFRAAKEKAKAIVLKEYWNARAEESNAEEWLAQRIGEMEP